MFANPTIQDFIDRQIGGQTPANRAPPPTPPYNGALARALIGNVTLPRQFGSPFAAPAIRPGRGLEPPLPTQGIGRGEPQVLSQAEFRPPYVNTGASALTAGLGKLGQGIEDAANTIKAKRDQAAKDAAGPGAIGPRPWGAPAGVNPPRRFGTPAASAPSFSPIGAANPSTPIWAQPGTGTGPMGSSIGNTGSALPIMAQGGGAQTAGGPLSTAQFLTGIKAGEGVPYSGFSSTGAIGAYGLTGDFIKQYAPGAGLPTDRASYMNNPALQDQLAAHAATQMYQQYGSWPQVANAWLTGSPTATTSVGNNMRPADYVAKVMNAAGAQPVPAPTGAAAYAATPPTGAPTGFASDAPQPMQSAQSVIPGQTDPHQPGFDPSSVKFINTPIPGGSSAIPGGANQTGVYGGQPYTFQTQPALGQQGMLMPPQPDALALALAGQGDPNAVPLMSPGVVAALDFGDLFGGGQFGAG